MTARRVAIVPHTHWDREWYEPFQVFRVRLVRLLDELLPMLDRDLSYARFLLDGQTVVIDDYLDIRPDQSDTITRLVASGRVSIGPWKCLMDEFMVSGETIVRNLQTGMLRSSELGGMMPVGYLPDMFGHIAQMPQILRLAGIGHAVVWRGVPAAIDKNAFWWVAPDGSRVRAEYLYGSYSNGRDLPSDPEKLAARARNYELELGAAAFEDGGILLMNGTDHHLPQPGLGTVVAEANDAQDAFRFEITSLAEYLELQPVTGLPDWWGELRSGARANVLMGVASNRVDVHQACARAERALERRAEPLSALFLPADQYPQRLLDEAWHLLVLNSAHDSSCACSNDEVVAAVLTRYHEARQLADALAHDVVERLSARVDADDDAIVVVNPTAVSRAGTVVVHVPDGDAVHFVTDDGVPCPAQEISTASADGLSTVVVGQKIRWVLDLMRGHEFAGRPVARATRTPARDGVVDVVIVAASPGDDLLDLDAIRAELLEDGEHGRTIRVRQELPTSRVMMVEVPDVPGFGWVTVRPADGAGPTTGLVSETGVLANDFLRVAVDPSNGTLTITTTDGVSVRGANQLVESGDGGDTYNYSPPTADFEVHAPEFVHVRTVESGPVRSRILVDALYQWPAAALGDETSCTRRSDETVLTEVRTYIELRSHERFVRIRVEFDHRVRDHRLRAHFPLPARVSGSDAECAFTVVHRGLTVEGGPHEHGLPTFVSRRFVDASDGKVGLAVLHDGLLEYEVVDGGKALALTLLRATGYLSRAEPSLRPNPAGPLLPIEGAQIQKPVTLEYALLPHHGDWEAADLYAAADDFLVPFDHAPTGGAGPDIGRLPQSGQGLAVDGAVVSAVLRDAGGVVVRLFNPRTTPVEASLQLGDGPASGWIVDFLGAPLEGFTESVSLRPSEIVTLRLA